MKSTEDMTAKIDGWKKKYGDIFSYEADGLICYMHRPSRTTIAAASVVVITNCWLGGDEELRTNDKYFMGLSQKVSELIEIKVGELKKL